MTGSSYTTISIKPSEEPRIGVSIHPDALAKVEYYSADKHACAFIRIGYGACDVFISTTSDTEITGEHLRFANELVEAATSFLADCERLHAEQNAAA
ncbi:hypothetical protein [Nonomuraea harbinensis]|uniref:DUF1876 domain-containing protein n=1 Tax=Nonomuraea harbinensis TaxID=1286938 RepID=A0ABW1C701_9ACTN|nr:hypothetical protein [Nonomuraea harbinensis]